MFGRPMQPRASTVEIDLLPQVAPPRRMRLLAFLVEEPYWVVALLGFFSLALLIAERSNVTAQSNDMKDRVAEAELRSQVTLPKEVRELRERVEAARKRTEGIEKATTEVRKLQWPWSQVARLVASLQPREVYLSSISQGENVGAITVEGGADREAAVLAYATALERTGLFLDVAVLSLAANTSPEAASPRPTAPELPARGPVALVPPPPAPRLAPTPTPTPVYEYTVASRTRSALPGRGHHHEIRGQVVDRFRAPVPGLTFRISSCCPEWSALYPKFSDQPAPGAFEFFVLAGTFRVEILNAAQGRAQAATELYVADSNPDEYFEWYIVFRKTTDSAPALLAPTPTFVPTPAGRPTLVTPAALSPTAQATATPSPTPTAVVLPTPIFAAPFAGLPATTPAVAGATPGTAIAPASKEVKGALTFTIALTLKTIEEATR